MLTRLPDRVTMDDDMVPGGDIRLRNNSWLRSAFKAAALTKVPRETQFRLAIARVVAKKKIGILVN